MTISRFSKTKAIPSISTKKSSPSTTNFAKGIYTYKPNDTMDYDEVYLAQNARFDRIGEYKTRRGLAKLCEPIGKSTVSSNYTSSYTMKSVDGLSLAITVSSPIYSINLTVASTNNTDYGVLQAVLLDSDDNVVATSCANNLTTTPTDTEFIFKDAPTGNLTLKLSTQGIAKQKFKVATVSGNTLMYKVNTATEGQVTNVFEANINGTKTVLFTFKNKSGTTTLYRMAEDKTITSIRTLPNDVEKVRFLQNPDIREWRILSSLP